MEATCFSETSIVFQRNKLCYAQKDRTVSKTVPFTILFFGFLVAARELKDPELIGINRSSS
jgi:hypothetical protein